MYKEFVENSKSMFIQKYHEQEEAKRKKQRKK